MDQLFKKATVTSVNAAFLEQPASQPTFFPPWLDSSPRSPSDTPSPHCYLPAPWGSPFCLQDGAQQQVPLLQQADLARPTAHPCRPAAARPRPGGRRRGRRRGGGRQLLPSSPGGVQEAGQVEGAGVQEAEGQAATAGAAAASATAAADLHGCLVCDVVVCEGTTQLSFDCNTINTIMMKRI